MTIVNDNDNDNDMLRLRREEDSRIRAEQEAEYREALAADRKKKEDKVKRGFSLQVI